MPLFLAKPARVLTRCFISQRPSMILSSPVETRRHIRIKKADGTVESGTDPSEKEYKNPDGRHRSGPSEGHTVTKGGSRHREGSLDPQAQGAQSSMHDPKSETPSQIHGQLYKGDSTGTGGAERGGQTEAAPSGSWWEALKHKLGFNAAKGNQAGERRK